MGDGNQSEDTVGGYTSGAFTSDDNFVSLEAGRTAKPDYGDLRGCKINSTPTGMQSDSPSVMIV